MLLGILIKCDLMTKTFEGLCVIGYVVYAKMKNRSYG